METNQKDKQKKIILAAVLVVMLIVMLFLSMQMFLMRNDIADINTQLQELKMNLSYAEQNVQSGAIGEEGNSTEEVNQAISSEIVTKRPDDGKAEEPQAKHKVYLTFDDGPSKQTETILDILDEYDVKATFFVVGKEDAEASERLKKIYERGHTIGMHSFSHDYTKIYESVDAFREDFLKIKQYIYDAIGVESKLYRFPGGSSNTLSKINMGEFVAFLQEQGVEYYDWNISSGDGGGKLMPADMILKNSLSDISRYDTSIILLHDSANKTTTVEALPQLLEAILAMEDTLILPLTESSRPIHHVIEAPVEEITEE